MEENANIEVEQTTEQEETVTMTKSELDMLLQKEGDKRVTSALQKAEKKNADKVREAQKLSAMNESQKYEYELEQREAAIAEKERQLALAENKNACSKILSDKGISLDLVEFVVAEDADQMNTNIKKLELAFKKSVKAEVEKRLGSNSPKQNLLDPNSLTKEQFNKMSLVEQNRLSIENPELYKTLIER